MNNGAFEPTNQVMIKQLQTFVILTPLLISVACDKKIISAEPKSADSAAKDAQESSKDELADPADVDKTLHPLKLTIEQNELVKAWIQQRGDKIDPVDFAKFIQPILHPNQREAFHKLTKAGHAVPDKEKEDTPE